MINFATNYNNPSLYHQNQTCPPFHFLKNRRPPFFNHFWPLHLFSPSPFFFAFSLSFFPQRLANLMGYSVHSEVPRIYSVLCLSVFKLAFFRRVVRFRRRPVGLGGRFTFFLSFFKLVPFPNIIFSHLLPFLLKPTRPAIKRPIFRRLWPAIIFFYVSRQLLIR